MSRAVIAGYARTPFHFARKGKLAAVRPDDLAAIALRGLVTRLGLEPALVEDVLMGCAYPEGEQGTNVARIATLLAGFPDTVAGATINRFCGSSMTAVHYAAGQIAIGAGEAFICAGVESMTRVPQGGFSFSPNPIDVVELNEAFASQAVACMRELGISLERTHIDGGAIALGHPLGATGARITGKAAQILRREGKRYALATQCIGGGQGIATVLE